MQNHSQIIVHFKGQQLTLSSSHPPVSPQPSFPAYGFTPPVYGFNLQP